jgi:hypothetical protein
MKNDKLRSKRVAVVRLESRSLQIKPGETKLMIRWNITDAIMIVMVYGNRSVQFSDTVNQETK